MNKKAKTPAAEDPGSQDAPGKGLAGADVTTLIREIRTGLMSWKEIGDRYGVTSQAVLQWAQRRKIKRGDLASEVSEATRAMVSGAASPAAIEAASTSAVTAAAAANLTVVLRHRADLQRLRDVHDKAMRQIEEKAEVKFDGNGDAVKFFSALESAARIVKLVIEKERQAHGIDDAPPQTEDYEAMLAAALGQRDA